MQLKQHVATLGLTLAALGSHAADYPAPQEGDWMAPQFRFHTGQVLPSMRVHYTTVGQPTGEPVLVLHGTTGSGKGMLTPEFAGSCSAPASHWMPAATTPSCRTRLARASRPNRRTACAQPFHRTTTTTRCWRNTGY